MNKKRIKIAYTDIRAGNVVINPIIQFVNFVMLFYIVIDELIPFYVFVPLFLTSLIFSLLFIGRQFRVIQSSTDLRLQFEKNTELAKSLRLISEGMLKFTLPSDPTYQEIQKQITYLKRIEENEKH